jgi:hypothetical protein
MNSKGPQGALFAMKQMFLTLTTWFDRSVKRSMKKQPLPPNVDAYVAGLGDWQRTCVERLRAVVTRPGLFEEVIKWGHLVYLSNGPAILIRAEDTRVLFGFWRGRRLISIQPLLKPGGKYEMARLSTARAML